MGDDDGAGDPIGEVTVDGMFAQDELIVGHFEVGSAGVGPAADATSGEFYPIMSTVELAAPGSSSP